MSQQTREKNMEIREKYEILIRQQIYNFNTRR